MKKHLLNLAIKKYGSKENYEETKKKREKDKFERDLNITKDIFTTNIATNKNKKRALSDLLIEDDDNVNINSNSSTICNNSNSSGLKGSKKMVSAVKKKKALQGMINVMRGSK